MEVKFCFYGDETSTSGVQLSFALNLFLIYILPVLEFFKFIEP